MTEPSDANVRAVRALAAPAIWTHSLLSRPRDALRVLEATKLLSTFVALVITRLVLEHPAVVEQAAGAALLIERVGWYPTAILTGIVICALFDALDRYRMVLSATVPLAIAFGFVVVSVANAINDIRVFAAVAAEVSVGWSWVAFVVSVGVCWTAMFAVRAAVTEVTHSEN